MLARWMIVISASLFMIATAQVTQAESPRDPLHLRPRIEKALDQWCRWLSGYLYQVPGSDLYTLNPTRGTGRGAYRDVAGNAFAAAAAGYWLDRHEVDEKTAAPLRGLIKLSLGTHMATGAINRPDISKWGATQSFSDDWHADLFAAAQGMLMLSKGLKGERHKQVAAIVKWEADKQVEYGINKKRRSWPDLKTGPTCAESNAWSAALLQVARAVLSSPDRDEAWRESAIQYSVNAICMPVDMTSNEVVAGKPLKDRVKGANFHPGGIQEHHGFYHPGYMGWPLAYEAIAQVCDRQLPSAERNPDVYLHNWKIVFDRLKQSTCFNGRLIYCAGDDWITYGYGNTQFFLASLFAAAEFQDADAALMVEEWLKLIEHQQKLGNGSVLAARLATFQRLRINDFSWYEAQEGCALAQALWLLEHMDTSKMPPPATATEYNKQNISTYLEADARLAWHRDEHRLASASWRSAFNSWQFVVQPVSLPHLLKFNHNGIGRLDISGVAHRQEIAWCNMDKLERGGFWSLGQINRESKKVTVGNPVFPLVKQYQAFIALPEGPTILVDCCQAADQVWILRDGGLGLRLAADVFNDNAVHLRADGQQKTFGPTADKDIWHELGGRAVTIEKLLSIHALAGEGTFQLLQKRARSSDRSELLEADDNHGEEESLLTHELCFGPPAYERPRIVGPGEWFRKQVMLFYCDPAATPALTEGIVDMTYPCITVNLPAIGCVIAVNLDEAEHKARTARGEVSVPPRSIRVAR